MMDYGSAPAPNEIEVTLFGPGYGEAIAVHLGEGVWMTVDSCIDPQSKAPAAGTYLDQIGVSANQVRVIVASHWHDDHVRGISALAAKHPSADFVLSAVLNSKEAGAFAAAYSGASSAGLARGSKEIFSVVDARESVSFALHKSIVFDASLNGRSVLVSALSPLSAAFAQSVARMAEYAAKKNGAINSAPELRANMEAVALHIDLGDDAILLGADLEEHETFGWSAVVADSWSGARRPSTAFKVAHHGSITGECPKVWATLLKPDAVACLTPFTVGDLRLPTDADKVRVRGYTPHAYISSGATRRPDMDSRQLKRLSDVCKNLARVDAGFGAVRLRKPLGASSWNIDLFGSAQPLH